MDYEIGYPAKRPFFYGRLERNNSHCLPQQTLLDFHLHLRPRYELTIGVIDEQSGGFSVIDSPVDKLRTCLLINPTTDRFSPRRRCHLRDKPVAFASFNSDIRP